MFGCARVNRDEVDAARPARHLVGTGSPRRFDVPARDVTSDGRVKLNPRSLRRHRYERSGEAGRECRQLLCNHDLQSLSRRSWLRRRGSPHRIARKARVLHPALPAPLNDRAHDVPVGRLPPSAPPLRTHGRLLPGLRRNRLQPHLLPQTRQMRRRPRRCSPKQDCEADGPVEVEWGARSRRSPALTQGKVNGVSNT